MTLRKFPSSVEEKIGSYVYVLQDPRNEEIFYIGKGKSNRVFSHINAELEMEKLQSEVLSVRLDKIREIHNEGFEVKHFIVRHGLTENEAFEVEAALIDFVGLSGLTNLVRGYESDDRGRMNVHDIVAKYEAPKAVITEPVILIRINKYFRHDMPSDILYEITRGSWKLSKRREKARYAFAVYRGIIREIYRIDRWHSRTDDSEKRKQWIYGLTGEIFEGGSVRWEFEGAIATELEDFKFCSCEEYQTSGAQNPIRYVNC